MYEILYKNIVLIKSIPRYSLMNLYVFEKMSLLAEGFTADVALERFLARVSPKMNLNVRFVEKSPITDCAPMNGFLLAAWVQWAAQSSRRWQFARLPLRFQSQFRGCLYET